MLGLAWLTSLRSITTQALIWSTAYAYYRNYLTDPKSKANGLTCSIISTIGTVVCYNIPVSGYQQKFSIVTSIFSGLFCGYLTWDLILNVWKYAELQSLSGIFHHVVFLSTIHYGEPRGYFPGSVWWLLAGEISTIFLHWRNTLAMKNRKDTIEYLASSYLFVITFIACRPVLIGYQLGKVILDRDQWQHMEYTKLIVGGMCAAYLLNLYWTYIILEKVVGKIFGLKISF